MKRAGFTMIELIFVIVILGILAAVALPRFVGVAEQAHEQKVEAFVGTLNRSIGPAMWAVSVADGRGGLINADCANLVRDQLNGGLIEELVDGGDCTFDANATMGGQFGIDFDDGNATASPKWRVAAGTDGATANW
ncbi:MAG: type II secretion system protein [Sulfurimonas sp.]